MSETPPEQNETPPLPSETLPESNSPTETPHKVTIRQETAETMMGLTPTNPLTSPSKTSKRGRPKGTADKKPRRRRGIPKASRDDIVLVVEDDKPRPPATLKRAGPPKPDEWQRWLEYALTLLTAFYTDQIIKPIEDLTESEKQVVDDANADFVKEFSEPLANILARSALSKKYGRQVVDSYDWVAVLVALWGYHRDLNEVRARRRQALAKLRGAPLHVAPNPQSPQATGVTPIIGIPFGSSID